MEIRRFILCLLCMVVLACGNDSNTTDDLETKSSDQLPVITEKAIEKLDYNDYALSEESELAVANWEKYKELAIQINYLRKADLSFFNGEKEVLEKFIEELKATIPEEFRNNPIISRTVILETTLLKLRENLTLENIDDNDKLWSVREVLVAFSNLNYQINKKLEYEYYNKIKPE